MTDTDTGAEAVEFFVVTTKNGMHVGLWSDEETAMNVVREESHHMIAKVICGKEHERVLAERDALRAQVAELEGFVGEFAEHKFEETRQFSGTSPEGELDSTTPYGVVEAFQEDARDLKEKLDAHPDDEAVDQFAVMMKAKLAKSREKGRGGWEDTGVCSLDFLKYQCREHTGKDNPENWIDVANLAMMVHLRDLKTPAPNTNTDGETNDQD